MFKICKEGNAEPISWLVEKTPCFTGRADGNGEASWRFIDTAPLWCARACGGDLGMETKQVQQSDERDNAPRLMARTGRDAAETICHSAPSLGSLTAYVCGNHHVRRPMLW